MSSFQAWLYCYQYHPRLKDTWGALHREGIDTQWYGVCRAQWKPLCTSKTWRIKSGKKGKDQEQIVHGHPQRSVWQSWELSPNLPAQNLSPVHQAHTVSTEDTSNRAFSPFILLFAYRFFPLQVITPAVYRTFCKFKRATSPSLSECLVINLQKKNTVSGWISITP